MPPNKAAWLIELKQHPLEVKPAPYTSPNENQIVVKTGAVAINPADWGLQNLGLEMFSWIKYPTILGCDVAGEVVEVGASASSRFRVGDRVLGSARSVAKGPAEGAFQDYVVLQANLSSRIPSNMTFEQASVFPLALTTAASGLFERDWLGLDYPTSPARKPNGKSIVIWGGSTSVGSNAIQLARAAGYEVITTSSPKNFDYVKSLGASSAFDYSSPDTVADIIKLLQGKEHAGAMAVGSFQSKGNGAASVEACVEIIASTQGKKFVACAGQPPENLPEGVEVNFINSMLLAEDELGDTIYRDFLPDALQEGSFKVAPEPEIVGTGLEAIEEAIQKMGRGVSARKLVVSVK